MARDTAHGLLVIDKPAGMTSRAVVDHAQRWFPPRTRLGHTGTLDPLATGVLVLCVGAATRLAEYIQRMPKTYRAGIALGARSDTDDADGHITPVPDATPPGRAELVETLRGFVGTLDQVPPAFSAAHVDGRRAYDLARRGAEVSLTPRPVTIHVIDLERYEYPHLELNVACGKGTYIRSLARDLGAQLGCGAYIESLRRTRVGCFDEARACPLTAGPGPLLPLAEAVSDLPRLTLSPRDVEHLRHGRPLPLPPNVAGARELAAFDEHGVFVGVVRVDAASACLRADKVIAG